MVGTSYVEERQERRVSAIKQWAEMLMHDLSASDVGVTSKLECQDGLLFEYVTLQLDAIFALKSPNTLLKRLYSIKMFHGWMMTTFGRPWLPFNELEVWTYLNELRRSSAAATRATSLLEAIRFSFFILQVTGAKEVLESRRVKGIAAQMFASKRPWKPADAFTTAQVVALHKAFEDTANHLTDRVILGHILHLLYSRSRFADLLAVEHLMLDDEKMYFELGGHLPQRCTVCRFSCKVVTNSSPCNRDLGQKLGRTLLAAARWSWTDYPNHGANSNVTSTSQRLHRVMDWPLLDLLRAQRFHQMLFQEPRHVARRGQDHVPLLQSDSNFVGSEVWNRSWHSCSASASRCGYQDADSLVQQRFDIRSSSEVFRSHWSNSRTVLLAWQDSGWHAYSTAWRTSFQPERVVDNSATTRTHSRPSGSWEESWNARRNWTWGECFGVLSFTCNPRAIASQWGGQTRGWFPNTRFADRSDRDFRWGRSVARLGRKWKLRVWMGLRVRRQFLWCGRWGWKDQGSFCSHGASAPSAKYFINCRSLVLHCLKDANRFVCGRIRSDSYAAVAELNGLRCGRCFNWSVVAISKMCWAALQLSTCATWPLSRK